MSDRYNYLTVVLERDLKDEDGKPLIEAIKMLRGVLSVTPNVSNIDDHFATMRARAALSEKLWNVLYEKEGSKEG